MNLLSIVVTVAFASLCATSNACTVAPDLLMESHATDQVFDTLHCKWVQRKAPSDPDPFGLESEPKWKPLRFPPEGNLDRPPLRSKGDDRAKILLLTPRMVVGR